MKFDTAGRVGEVVWNMRLSELPRSENRVILNRLYNGQPPFDASTADQNGIQVNRNFLEGTNLLANARRQWNRAMLGTGNYFSVSLDSGPAHKRRSWSSIITKHINRILKNDIRYMEYLRGMGGTVMLHGIAPANWPSKTDPFIQQIDVEDLLVPSDTRVTFDNTDHFAIWRSWTPAQLYNLTHGPKVDKGWNLDAVNNEIKAKSQEAQKNAYSLAYQFQPEKIEEYIKGDMGFWGSDAVPTIDAWDFYFREAEDGDGWYRRIILDVGMSPDARKAYLSTGTKPKFQDTKEWIYTSGKNKYASSLREIIHCQFADCSAVFPGRYHSQRALGYMIYGVCELSNRLRCQFTQSVFEQMMWLFRAGGPGDLAQIKKAQFRNMAVIPQGVSWVTADERFKPDANLVELWMANNRQLMSESAGSYTQDINDGSQKEMTATEAMARVNNANALMSGMLALSYNYEEFQYRETCRRFCIKHSPHPIVRKFQLDCMTDGVPKEMINSDRWEIKAEKVMGGGNKILEIAQADKLIGLMPSLDPEAQQTVKHIYIEANTDDPDLAERLAPVDGQPQVSDATHDAELAASTMLQGLPMRMKRGLNHMDYVEALITAMKAKIGMIEARGGMATIEELIGMQNLAGISLQNQPTSENGIAAHIQIIAQDPQEKQRVKMYSDELGNAMNMIKAYAQRLQQQQQEAQAQPQTDPKDAAKIQSMLITAQAKAANTRESHAQRTQQRDVAFQMEQQRKEQEHQLEMRRTLQQQNVDDVAAGLKTSAEIQREKAKAEQVPETTATE